MLKFFRSKNVTKFVLWIIIILILPAFVLFGTERLSLKKGPKFAGFINSKKVSFDALYESMIAVRSQLILNYWNNAEKIKEVANDRPLIAKLAWERLIMLSEAKKNKIVVTDRELTDYLRNHPIFLRNGSFDDKLYQYILQHNIGLSPRSFEEIVRKNLQVIKLKAAALKEGNAKEDEWLARISAGAKPNIDFNEIDKYYKQ